MLVSDILRRKGTAVVTVAPGATVGALVSLLADRGIGAAVVSADGHTVEGIASERDVVRALARMGAAALDSAVGEICTHDVRQTEPGETVEGLMLTMTESKIRHMPVDVSGALHGLVSIGDVVKARLDELDEERRALASYIQGG